MNDLLGTIGGQDIAFTWIKTLFADDPGKPLSAAFAIFSSTLAMLGSLFMGWHVLTGIVSSAYSGKVLGDRWHQIWAPLRVVLGFGLLVPVGGGFSSVHYLLKDVVGVAAVNLGNAPIVAYIDAATDRKNNANLSATYGVTLADEFAKKEICYAVVSYLNQQTVGRGRLTTPRLSLPDPAGENASYFSTDTHLWDYGACGSIAISKVKATDFSANSSYFQTASDTSVINEIQSAIAGDNTPALLSNFDQSRLDATKALLVSIRSDPALSQSNLSKLAAFLGENGAWNSENNAGKDGTLVSGLVDKGLLPNSAAFIGRMKGYSDNWNKSVSDAAQNIFKVAADNNAKQLKNMILSYGFMVAGSYERSLSAISGMAVNLAASSATLEPIKLSEIYKGKVVKAVELFDGLNSFASAEASAAEMSKPSDDTDWGSWLVRKIFPASLANMQLGTQSADPVGDMMTLGHTLLNTASLGILAVIAAASLAAAPSTISQAPLAGFNTAMTYITPIIFTMVLVGFLYAFVLPMLPMIMVFTMGLSWLILFLEASIAGVLWSFAFIRMDGQEFFDKNQAPGVTLIFNLLLRPALGMLAYCGLLLLQPLLLNSLAVIWKGSFHAQTGNISVAGFVWIWQFVAQLLIFSYLQWHLNIRLAGLIPSIPDRVGHWMGMQMHGYNDAHETGNLVAVGVGVAPMVQRGIGSAAQTAKANMDRKEQAANQKNQQQIASQKEAAESEWKQQMLQATQGGSGNANSGSGNGQDSKDGSQSKSGSGGIGGISDQGSVRGGGPRPNSQNTD